MKMTHIILLLFAIMGCTINDMDDPGNLVPRTVTEDPYLPRFEVNGTILHGEAFGDIHNHIVIFLHGGPGSDYRAFISEIGVENASRYPNRRTITTGGISRLQDEFYCVFYDQRGAGLSPRYDRGEVTFQRYLDDLDCLISFFLEKKKTETGVTDTQVSLVGWSWGGTLATGYINRNPERIKTVALYEPGPFSKKAYKYFLDHTTSYFTQIGKDWVEEYLLAHDHITPDSHIRGDYLSLLGAFRSNPQFHENNNTPLWRFGSFLEGEDLQDEDRDNTSNLSAYQGKLLFIAGELSRKEYPEYADIQMSYYPRSEYIEIAGVGHTGVWEKPGIVSDAIRLFFNSN